MVRYLQTIALMGTAGSMIVLAPPAAARDVTGSAATAAAAAGSSSASQEKAKVSPSKVRYCLLVEPSTASRIAQRQCRTKADWLTDGIDVSKLK